MPYTEETKLSRSLTSDVSGRTVEVDETPEPFKWPASKDLPALYIHADEADALTAFLASPSAESFAAMITIVNPPKVSKKGSAFASAVREFFADNPNVDAGDHGRVKAEAYKAYFVANPDVTVPDDASREAKKAYAEAHASN